MRDKEKQREYQHNWYLRKKYGSTTRTTKKYTDEERKNNRKLSLSKYNLKYNKLKKDIIDNLFGKTCFFCGDKVKIIHRKDGMPHKKINAMSINELNNINKDDYVRVCRLCHRGIHWTMKYLNLSWEEICSKKKG